MHLLKNTLELVCWKSASGIARFVKLGGFHRKIRLSLCILTEENELRW